MWKSRQVATLSFLPQGKTGLKALFIPTSSLKQMVNTWHWSLLMDQQLLLRSTFPVNILTSHLALAGKQPSFVSYLQALLPNSWCLPTTNLDNNGKQTTSTTAVGWKLPPASATRLTPEVLEPESQVSTGTLTATPRIVPATTSMPIWQGRVFPPRLLPGEDLPR